LIAVEQTPSLYITGIPMNDIQHILIADHVPLANKGEEAIARGISDMLRDEREVQIGLFDNVEQITHCPGITVFPSRWILRVESRQALPEWGRTLGQALVSVQLRLEWYSRLKRLVNSSGSIYRPLQEFFESAEYVVVGHDGVFCAESCGIIHLAKREGKCVGILGASTGVGRIGKVYKSWLYRRAISEVDFCVFREQYSFASMNRALGLSEKFIVGPDPAFAMKPEEPQTARKILRSDAHYKHARRDKRQIVAAAVLEKGEVYARFKPELKGIQKQKAHAKYLAAIFDGLIAERDAFIVFLPHAIEHDSSDITAAQHVTEAMKSGSENYTIIDQDMSARLLKAIIKECDFLVGQRTHSLIGSVAVATPFMGLTNRRDNRTHGIIGDMCRCESCIVDMDVTDERAVSRKALELFDDRINIKKSLRKISRELLGKLDEISKMIRSKRDSVKTGFDIGQS
jgi:polysaccharide pyruvyl transferase WcaK-like protein